MLFCSQIASSPLSLSLSLSLSPLSLSLSLSLSRLSLSLSLLSLSLSLQTFLYLPVNICSPFISHKIMSFRGPLWISLFLSSTPRVTHHCLFWALKFAVSLSSKLNPFQTRPFFFFFFFFWGWGGGGGGGCFRPLRPWSLDKLILSIFCINGGLQFSFLAFLQQITVFHI